MYIYIYIYNITIQTISDWCDTAICSDVLFLIGFGLRKQLKGISREDNREEA